MNLFLTAFDHLCEAKKTLIDLMADEIRTKREIAELKIQITNYEGYAVAALKKDNQSLAMEIAEKIVQLISTLTLEEKLTQVFHGQISRLQRVVHRYEDKVYNRHENLQYLLDYLDAAAELESDDWALDQKMLAAGIGPQANSKHQVLARIRASH